MKFGLLGNPEKKNISSILNSISDYFIDKKIEFFIDKNLNTLLKSRKFVSHFRNTKELLKESDIVISLGGDGTFLRTAQKVGKKGIPILGVNFGTLGFMSEVKPSEILNFLTDIENNKYKIIDLCLISSKKNNKPVFTALNEIVIDKCDSIRMVELEICYNKEVVGKFYSDGVLISTPTGSTGYSLSAGGPIISPYSKVFIITPICPHTLNFRPVIVPDDGIITIKAEGKNKIRFTADGFQTKIFNSPSEFTISKADYTIKTIKKINKTYFQTLNSKLFWSADIREKNKN